MAVGQFLLLLVSARHGQLQPAGAEFGIGKLVAKLLKQHPRHRRRPQSATAFADKQGRCLSASIARGILFQDLRQHVAGARQIIQRQVGAQTLIKRLLAKRPADGGKIREVIQHRQVIFQRAGKILFA